jgi:hypothetical protein
LNEPQKVVGGRRTPDGRMRHELHYRFFYQEPGGNEYFFNSFSRNGQLFIQEQKGLLQMKDDSLTLVPKGETFASLPVTAMIPLDSKKILIGTGFKCRRIGEETNDETGDFIHINPPSKFPNQGVLAFPGAPCKPNFRGPKIAETGSQRRGPPEG